VTRTSDFPLRTSDAAQEQMAEPAFSLLRLQAETPAGAWVDQHFRTEYQAVWERARSLAGESADEDLFLSELTHAHVLLASGTGVWGPRGLGLGPMKLRGDRR